MQVRKYVARDMRQALAMVREAQGPDVLILSNRKVTDGVEIITADDKAGPEPKGATAASNSWQTKELTEHYKINEVGKPAKKNLIDSQPASSYEEIAQSLSTERKERPTEKSYTTPSEQKGPQLIWTQESMMEQMRDELSSLRGLMENQVSGLAWGDMQKRFPTRASILRKLIALGLDPALAKYISNKVPSNMAWKDAWRRGLGLLARQIPINSDAILANGGVISLVGPTGVGKTTLIAKLAARHVLTKGNQGIALVTTDCHRVGAIDQLKKFGKILDVPVWSVNDAIDLRGVLDSLKDYDLVLIDTAGFSHRDAQLKEKLLAIKDVPIVLRNYLVLSAATEFYALKHVAETFNIVAPEGLIVTKVDEAASLGPSLSIAIKHELPIAYISEGQRIPDDLITARANSLVVRAVTLMKETGPRIEEVQMEQVFMRGDSHAANLTN